jgi:hypothetical protein
MKVIGKSMDGVGGGLRFVGRCCLARIRNSS